MNPDDFEPYRYLLEGLAYRMCGSWVEAQDIVQEAHIRWSAADAACIHDPRAWLVTVCSRLSMDVLKSARIQRVDYVGTWLPEPYPDRGMSSPDTQLHLDDSLSMALMLALERLTPLERAVFLLHDVFGYGFRDIAAMTEKSEVACRKSATRARCAVRVDRPRFDTDPEMHRRLLNAFFEAVHLGDPDSLKALLAESIAFRADGGGRANTAHSVLQGREAVAAFFLEVWQANVPSRESVQIVEQRFNGAMGALIYQRGQLLVALTIEAADSRIHTIFAQRNPEKLIMLSRFQSEQG